MEMAKVRNQTRAKFIRDMRVSRAWSQEQLATIAEVSSRTIQRIEKGGIADFESLRGIAQAFDLDVSELMNITELVPPSEKLKKHFEGVTFFTQMKSGKNILDLGRGTLGIVPGIPQAKDKNEANIFGNFVEFVRDCFDHEQDVSIATFLEWQVELDLKIKEFSTLGYFVFGTISNASIEVSNPLHGKVLNLLIVESNHPAIVGDDSHPRMIAVKLGDQLNIRTLG